MADRPHVPRFGNWESEDNVPYTVYFEKARKGRTTGGKMINPNDPQENPEMFPDVAPSSAQATPPRTRNATEGPIGQAAVRPTHERRVSREDVDVSNHTESHARNGNTGRKAANESSAHHQRQGGRGTSSGRPLRQSAGSEHSIERSPLHPHHQARVVGRSTGSPAREGKNSYDSSHGTPGRSRLKPVAQGDESPDGGAAVPRFGEWDEKNPSSADNYTHIFNKVREERHTGPGKSPGRDSEHSSNYTRKQNQNDSAKVCCFPWGRK